MPMVGGDAEAMFGVANELRRRRSDIQNAVTRLSALVEQANWVGPDRDAFVREWTGTHVPSLSGVLNDIERAASRVARSAQAQQEASGR